MFGGEAGRGTWAGTSSAGAGFGRAGARFGRAGAGTSASSSSINDR
jgi:hypothetical protein